MKYLSLLMFVVFVSCDWTDGGREEETYTYTVRNESGRAIEIISGWESSENTHIIVIEDEKELIKIYMGYGYNFESFFSSPLSISQSDYTKIIYGGERYKIFDNSNNQDERNPIGVDVLITGDDYNKTFVFTEKDYNNAIDCDENCD